MPQHLPPRIYRRVPFETAVRLEFDRFRGFVDQVSANLSLGGMFIRSDAPPPVGTLVPLEFRLDDGFELIRGTGRVTWVRPGDAGETAPPGFGIRFLDLTPGSRELIFRLVERRVKEGGGVFESEAEELDRARSAAGDEAGLTAAPWELPAARAAAEAEPSLPFWPRDAADVARDAALAAETAAAEAEEVAEVAARPEGELAAPEPPPVAATAPDESAMNDQEATVDASLAPPADPEAAAEGAGAGALAEDDTVDEAVAGELPGAGGGDAAALPAGSLAFDPADGTPAPSAAEEANDSWHGWSAPPAAPAWQETWPAAGEPTAEAAELPGEGEPFEPVVDRRAGGGHRRRGRRWPWAAAAAAGLVLLVGGGFLVRQRAGAGDGPPAETVAPAEAAGEGSVPAGPPVAPAAAPASGAPEPTAAPRAAVADGTAAGADEAPLRRISRITWPDGDGAFLIWGDGPIRLDAVDHFRLDGGEPRLVVRIRGVDGPFAGGPLEVGGERVRRVRTGFHPAADGRPPELHVVFDLAASGVETRAVEEADGRLRVAFGGS